MNTLSFLRSLKYCAFVSLLQVLVISAASAATLVVDNAFDDTSDANSDCTLRKAIESINNAQDRAGCVATGVYGNNDAIDFGVDNITSLESSLDITNSVTINLDGEQVTIASASNDGVFNIEDATVSFDNVVITGGVSTGRSGGISITDNGVVSLNNCIVENNIHNGTLGGGGGISVIDSMIVLRNCIVRNNRVNANGRDGGGIFIDNSTLTLIGSTVSGNTTTDDGGGVFIQDGSFTIENSTIANNISGDEGGGLQIRSVANSTIINSTVSGNTADDIGGGFNAESLSLVSIINTTLSNNTANRTGGGISISSGTTLNASNSLIAGNIGGDALLSVSEVSIGTPATFNLINNNLIGDSSKTSDEAFSNRLTGNAIFATSDGNSPRSLDSILEPLSENGGPTQTHALVPGSPALNALQTNLCPATDQRGLSRGNGVGLCDIGAFEAQADEMQADDACFVVPTSNNNVVIFCL